MFIALSKAPAAELIDSTPKDIIENPVEVLPKPHADAAITLVIPINNDARVKSNLIDIQMHLRSGIQTPH